MNDKKSIINTSMLVLTTIFAVLYIAGMIFAAKNSTKDSAQATPQSTQSASDTAPQATQDTTQQTQALPTVAPVIPLQISATQPTESTQPAKKVKEPEDD